MTGDELISEGRRLQRPCAFLRSQANGLVAPVWYHEKKYQKPLSSDYRPWLTVDSRCIPGLPSSVSGYLTIYTDEVHCEGGRVEVTASWPQWDGTPLYAHAASVLPPVEVVFRRGGEAIGNWLKSVGWERDWRLNGNFRDKAIPPYWDVLTKEFPYFFESDIYAMLGGWHFPGQDDDWEQLMDEHLMVLTFRHSEPWVEAWRMRSGEFKVFQRIT